MTTKRNLWQFRWGRYLIFVRRGPLELTEKMGVANYTRVFLSWRFKVVPLD